MFLYCVAKENNDLLLYFCACGENVGKNQAKKKDKRLTINHLAFHSVPLTVLFSNQFLEDLDKIWELRQWIPDPTKPILPPKGRK